MRKQKVIAIALSAMFLMSPLIGCTTTWISQAEQIIAVLVPAVTNILTLVAAFQGTAVSAQDLALVQQAANEANTDFQTISALLTTYNSSPAATQAATLPKITAALSDAQQNLGALLPELHIKDPATQAKISAVVGVVIAEIQTLAQIIPIVNPPAPVPATSSRVLAQKASAKSFKKTYNAVMQKPSGNAALDAVTKGLNLK